jgi:transposase
MWTNENRGRYDGNKRTVNVREVVNGVMYILSTGCQWGALPKDLPPRSTVNYYFRRWDYDSTLDRIHHALYVQCREHAVREASPTAAIIDSQSVKAAEKGGTRSTRRGMTPARKSKARSDISWSTRKAC